MSEHVNEVRQKLEKIQDVMETINDQEHLKATESFEQSKDLKVPGDKEDLTRLTHNPWQNDMYQKTQEADRYSQ